MENRLSDVQTIANEMIRRGEIGVDNADAEVSRIVRVERHVPNRSAAIVPTAVSFGLDEEIRKLNLQLETIRRSVEFTEAQVAVNRAGTGRKQDEIRATPPAGKRRTGPLIVGTNLILSGLLFAEIYGDFVSKIGSEFYRATHALIGSF
ncbi:hypothetical protein [Rhizobium sp. SAFR-030]|jgi:hypothetical protein|uniref:hypothetical protein n=1 Tax=Rhizobium sp. SAFR-030 TaxID=3387277 RepID=UPI003F805266